MLVTTLDVLSFQRFVRNWFKHYGRHKLPWRQQVSPYQILVSEVMLQQTQVDRVVPKYMEFITRFPQPIQLWQGLGYNRRVLNLQKAMQVVVEKYQGHLPTSFDELLSLPGIGPYTASAVCVFAFNQPVTVIETNIRALFIYHFFPNRQKVPDDQLLPLIDQTLDTDNPRNWYAALMDYGSYIKKVFPNPTRRSKHYSKQSTFKGSNRQLRGSILRLLSSNKEIEKESVPQKIDAKDSFSQQQIEKAVATLIKEGFIEQQGTLICLRKN
jgi:A/G-specific adenine glycosylase